MSQILLACRLAGRDLRHRPAQPLLLVLVLAAAMATLTLGLVLTASRWTAGRSGSPASR